MCDQDIELYPSYALRTQARQVQDFTDQDFHLAAKKLKETMHSYNHCVGLAANQVGNDLNFFVADASINTSFQSQYGFVYVINPEMVYGHGIEINREGCMSIPHLTGNVPRYKEIFVKAQNEQGQNIEFRLQGFEARVFQHEIDHLKGKVFLDRVRSSKDVYLRKKYR